MVTFAHIDTFELEGKENHESCLYALRNEHGNNIQITHHNAGVGLEVGLLGSAKMSSLIEVVDNCLFNGADMKASNEDLDCHTNKGANILSHQPEKQAAEAESPKRQKAEENVITR